MLLAIIKSSVFSIVLVSLISIACKNSNKELPDYVLGREAMIDVITDIHLIEAALAKKQNKGLLAFDLAEIYYDSLYAKYSISKAEIDSSIAYYSRRPEIFDAIYVKVITNLSKKESEIELESDTTQVVPDYEEPLSEPEEAFEPEPGREIRVEQPL